MATATELMSNSNIWQKTDSDPYSGGTDRLASDKHTFLKLLVAQLTNQDPLNPTEDKEFVAQLAQFTSLEQLQEINAGMGTLNTTMTQSQLMTATGFIGKNVVTTGDQVTKFTQGGNIYTTTAWYTFEQAAETVQATVLDSSGNIVYQEDLGARSIGSHQFNWNGRNMVGQEVPSGVYTVSITAQDKNGTTVFPLQQITARVLGVTNEGDGYKLILDGGRVVPLMNVTEITNADDDVGASNTYSGLAADQATAAHFAQQDAETYLAKALAAETAGDSKSWTDNAIKAAESAKTAYDNAQKIADSALKEAQSLKTAASLEEANKAAEQALKAKGHMEAAQAAAQAAKDDAHDRFDTEFT